MRRHRDDRGGEVIAVADGSGIRSASTPGLHWGIKASFLDYVMRMPDGRGWLAEGAAPSDSGVFVFEPDGPDFDRRDGEVRTLRFRGDVRFSAHAGLMFVRIADPWVTVTATSAELSVLDPSGESSTSRIVLAELELGLPQPPAILRAEHVRLVQKATVHFNDVYPAGEELDPLTVVSLEPSGV